MKYIAHKRFKAKTISGDVNIPAQTECELVGNLIMHNGKPICYATSYNGQQYFARDDDGSGMERGRLTQAIQKQLSRRDENHPEEHQKRWDKIWGDFGCRLLKAHEDENNWHWNQQFFEADITELRRIAELVGATVKGD
jgi:hypothetical protein